MITFSPLGVDLSLSAWTWVQGVDVCSHTFSSAPVRPWTTEAEWEKAARGGLVGKKYPWGDNEPDEKMANYGENVKKTTPVGQYQPNGYGLYDMAGNVWEWCLDEYQEDFYQKSPGDNPLAGQSQLLTNYKNIKTSRVLRGGSWGYFPNNVRVAVRGGYYPGDGSFSFGFRCTSPRFPQWIYEFMDLWMDLPDQFDRARFYFEICVKLHKKQKFEVIILTLVDWPII